MSLNHFLNPPDNDDLDEVIAFHLSQNLDPEFEAEPEDVPLLFYIRSTSDISTGGPVCTDDT